MRKLYTVIGSRLYEYIITGETEYFFEVTKEGRTPFIIDKHSSYVFQDKRLAQQKQLQVCESTINTQKDFIISKEAELEDCKKYLEKIIQQATQLKEELGE